MSYLRMPAVQVEADRDHAGPQILLEFLTEQSYRLRHNPDGFDPPECQTRSMGRSVRVLVLSGVLTACAACGSTTSSTASLVAPREPAGSIQAAAISWSSAFLTGTVADVRRMEGSECTYHSNLSLTFLSGYLDAMRQSLGKQLGMPADRVRITGVQTQDVTATQGEAEVQYDLPISKVGNDNWVTYQIQNGQWKEINCQAPIGGESTSTHAATAG